MRIVDEHSKDSCISARALVVHHQRLWEDKDKSQGLRDILLQGTALAESSARTIIENKLVYAQHDQFSSIMSMIKSASAETNMRSNKSIYAWEHRPKPMLANKSLHT